MKNKTHFLKTKILALCLMLAIPVLVSAQTNSNDPVGQGLGAVQHDAFPNQGGGGILGANTVVGVIAVIIKLMLFVAGALAVLFVVIGGIMYLTSAGNEEQAAKGRKTVTNALVGIIIIILSYVVVNVVVNLVNCGFSNIGIGGC